MRKPGSLLVVDIGSTMTTVALVDRVSGQHRFVARGEALTTYSPPWSNVLTGVQAAVHQIEQLTGHALMDAQGALLCPRTASGDGLDGCVVVSSAAPPMRVLLAGLTHDISLARARQAVAATRAHMVGCLALDEGMERRDPNAWLATLRHAQPEVIVIVGGTDGGADQPVTDLLNLVALHNRLLPPEARPVVCYAGNVDTLGVAAQTFAGVGGAAHGSQCEPFVGSCRLCPPGGGTGCALSRSLAVTCARHVAREGVGECTGCRCRALLRPTGALRG